MADPHAVADLRAKAELRLSELAPKVAQQLGLAYEDPRVNKAVEPALYNAMLLTGLVPIFEAIAAGKNRR
jgi:hypothetical protein